MQLAAFLNPTLLVGVGGQMAWAIGLTVGVHWSTSTSNNRGIKLLQGAFFGGRTGAYTVHRSVGRRSSPDQSLRRALVCSGVILVQ